MESKHKAFLEKYFAEENRQKQLSMLKDFMLSLPNEELLEFMQEPLRFLEKALRSPDVSQEMKDKIDRGLAEMTFLLKGKVSLGA